MYNAAVLSESCQKSMLALFEKVVNYFRKNLQLLTIFAKSSILGVAEDFESYVKGETRAHFFLFSIS